MLLILLMPLAMLAPAPLIRPFRWSRILLTYLLPLIPLLALIDGTVSMLRIYSRRNCARWSRAFRGRDLRMGYRHPAGAGLSVGLTYLIGVPAAPR
jgi:hypothetical protein